MAKVKDFANGPVLSGPTTGITAENYFDRAQAFVAARGSGFVIRALEGPEGSRAKGSPATEAQWVAWMEYFSAKGVKHQFLAKRGMGTVPTEWPEDFDLEAAISDRAARLPNRLTGYGDSLARDRVRHAAERLATEMQAKIVGRHREKWEGKPAKPMTLDELKAYYAANPVSLSAEVSGRPLDGLDEGDRYPYGPKGENQASDPPD